MMKSATPKRKRVEYRYYVIPENEKVLALLGDEWRREYGEGLARLHFHNYFEVGVCYEGTGKVVLDDKISDFAPGNIMVMPPNIPHTTNVEAGETAFWEWLYFDIESVVDEMFADEDSTSRRETLNQIFSAPLLLTKETYPTINKILELIIDEIKTKRPMYRDSINCFLQIFIVEILRIREKEEKKDVQLHGMMQIRPAIEFVHTHYQQEIRINDMSGVCNISESHFRKVFYQCMNMRPLDYVNYVRVVNACEFMKKRISL